MSLTLLGISAYFVPNSSSGTSQISTLSFTSASLDAGTLSTTIFITAPAGVQDGDFLLGMGSCRDSTNGNLNLAGDPILGPAGWSSTMINHDLGLRVIDSCVYYKRASSEPTSYVFTAPVPVDTYGFAIIRMSGVIGSGDPTDATQSVTTDSAGTGSTLPIVTLHVSSFALGLRMHRNVTPQSTNGVFGATATPQILQVGKLTVYGNIIATATTVGAFTCTELTDLNDRTLVLMALRSA